MELIFYKDENNRKLLIVFFPKKRFNVYFYPFSKREPEIIDWDMANVFFEEKPFALFKCLRKARIWNKHYGHVRNRPIDINKDYK